MLLAAVLSFVFFPQVYVFLHQHPDPCLAPLPAFGFLLHALPSRPDEEGVAMSIVKVLVVSLLTYSVSSWR